MDKYSQTILDIISSELGEEVGVFLFGSRARSENLEFSDYDIGLYGKKIISEKSLIIISDRLNGSNLPFKVDLIDFKAVKREFKIIALEEVIIWQNHSMIQLLIKSL